MLKARQMGAFPEYARLDSPVQMMAGTSIGQQYDALYMHTRNNKRKPSYQCVLKRSCLHVAWSIGHEILVSVSLKTAPRLPSELKT